MFVDKKVFENDESKDPNELFKFLDTIDVEYRKPYMRSGKTAHVPRGHVISVVVAARAPVASAAAGSATPRAANAQRELAMEPTAAESSRATVHDAISMAASSTYLVQ